MIDYNYLVDLIDNGYECEYLDYKSIQYNKEKHIDLIKDIMSMANSHFDGDKYIVIGIKAKSNGEKDIIGIPSEEFVDASIYQQIINQNIEPEIRFDYYPVEYNEKTLGIFEIHKSNNEKPYLMKKKYNNLHEGQCFIRKGATNFNALRRDFDLFYALKEKFEVKFMDSILAAAYPEIGCARINVTMRNHTKYPKVLNCGEIIIYNVQGEKLSVHPIYGYDDRIMGAEFRLSFLPMEERLMELCVGFSSTDCIRLGINEYGFTEERFVFQLNVQDTNNITYNDNISDGMVFATGDFLWKVKLK